MDVVVTGATGTVGRAVAERLVAAGAAVRPASPSTGFDWTDRGTWAATFHGAAQLFVVRPPHLSRPRRQMVPALDAAVAAGIRHVVLLSLQGAEGNRVVPHHALEQWCRASGVSWTFVRPSFFMQNLTGTHVREIRDEDRLVVPAGSGATAFVDTEDVAEVAARALLDPAGHAGRAWTPTGPQALTYDEVAEELSRQLGRTITYTRPGLLRYARHARRQRMPWAMVGVTAGIYTVARLGRAAGLTDDVLHVTGRPPTGFADFVRRERRAWLPSGAAPGADGATMAP